MHIKLAWNWIWPWGWLNFSMIFYIRNLYPLGGGATVGAFIKFKPVLSNTIVVLFPFPYNLSKYSPGFHTNLLPINSYLAFTVHHSHLHKSMFYWATRLAEMSISITGVIVINVFLSPWYVLNDQYSTVFFRSITMDLFGWAEISFCFIE